MIPLVTCLNWDFHFRFLPSFHLRDAQERGWHFPHEVDRRRGLVEQNPGVVRPPGLDGHDHSIGAVPLADRQRILTSHGEVDELPSLRL